jgi:hypothetical protein
MLGDVVNAPCLGGGAYKLGGVTIQLYHAFVYVISQHASQQRPARSAMVALFVSKEESALRRPCWLWGLVSTQLSSTRIRREQLSSSRKQFARARASQPASPI